MNKKVFKKQIAMGFGSIIILLKKNPDIAPKYFKIILWACCNDTSHDPQSEPDRIQYLYDIISLSGKRYELENVCLKKMLKSRNKKDWSTRQLLTLSTHFYKNGNLIAREAIFVMFKTYLQKLVKNHEHNTSYDSILRTCIECIIHIDGIKGLEFVVNEIGEKLVKYNIDYIDTELCEAKDILGNETVHKFLLTTSKQNENIKKFFDISQRLQNQYEINAENRKIIKTDFQSIMNIIDEFTHKRINYGSFIFYSRYSKKEEFHKFAKLAYYSRRVKKEDLIKFAKLVENTGDEKKQDLILNLFRFSPYPLNIDFLLKLTNSKNMKLVKTTLNALKNNKDQRIHSLAQKLIDKRKFSVYALSLLKLNFDNDYNIVLKTLKQEYQRIKKNDQYDFHSLTYQVLFVIENNKSPQFKDILIYLYYHNDCSNCRLRIVKLMLESDTLPQSIKAECQYDCNYEIRELVLNNE
ncbi:hypothetical protein KHQ81_04915 [Mycoplasmatota bacterium]|nr:hypothetical protein KHQ81_04915 [Mycoplasmatota bacterium]